MRKPPPFVRFLLLLVVPLAFVLAGACAGCPKPGPMPPMNTEAGPQEGGAVEGGSISDAAISDAGEEAGVDCLAPDSAARLPLGSGQVFCCVGCNTCDLACANLRALGCAEGFAPDGGATCEKVCWHSVETKLTDLKPNALAQARSKAEVHKIGTVRCP